jgi:hypothetical protein
VQGISGGLLGPLPTPVIAGGRLHAAVSHDAGDRGTVGTGVEVVEIHVRRRSCGLKAGMPAACPRASISV